MSRSAAPTHLSSNSDATSMAGDLSLSLGLDQSHVLITGAAGQIGSVVARAFLSAGAVVSAFDVNGSELRHERLHWQVVDITSEPAMEAAFDKARRAHGVIAVCIALAGLDLSFLAPATLCDMPLAQWERTHQVNVHGTFLTARSWLRGIRDYGSKELRNVSLVVIGSEAASFGVRGNAAYSSSKAAVQYGLVRSLTADVVAIHPRGRVNAIAPGPVDTPQFRKECAESNGAEWLEAHATVAMKTPVPVEAVARSCLFLASEIWSGNITGQVLSVDSGKSGTVYWLQDGSAP